MKQNKPIEVFGTLTKSETVYTIEQKILPGTLVFEALQPFPGYYYDTPTGSKPLYLYLALEESYELEDIIRASQKVNLEFGFKFDAGKGFLQVYDSKYNILRIRHLNDYNLLESLQRSFSENGIQFLHKTKLYKQELVKIRIIKIFKLQEIDEKIFLDKLEKNHAYIEIPHYLTWDEFEDLNHRVQYNWTESKFDAAMGAFYYHGELHELVRIFSDQIDEQYLKELRKLYLEKIK